MNQCKIWDVGQGLFYSGRVGDLDFVYDCGSLTPGPFLNECIEAFSNKCVNFRYLFVSHLDADHVNRIADLLHRFQARPRIFLPYLGSDPNIPGSFGILAESYLIAMGQSSEDIGRLRGILSSENESFWDNESMNEEWFPYSRGDQGPKRVKKPDGFKFA
ncbi:MAG: hypothetical protein LKK13_05155 [Bacilli bacterium]|jgi:hypothetical protein|nr:hypothetical protein [Bacilli bacterium]